MQKNPFVRRGSLADKLGITVDVNQTSRLHVSSHIWGENNELICAFSDNSVSAWSCM